MRKAGLQPHVVIESAAVSDEEYGNPVYPPVRRLLATHGIDCSGKTARPLTRADYARYDYLIGMDETNLRGMHRICGGDPDGKMSLLLAHAGRSGSIADPWYTGNFTTTWEDVLQGCTALLAELSNA